MVSSSSGSRMQYNHKTRLHLEAGSSGDIEWTLPAAASWTRP
jgi:hypothetical protein